MRSLWISDITIIPPPPDMQLPTMSDNNSCPNLYDHRDTARVLIPVVYSFIFLVGLLGNLLALHVIRSHVRKLNSTTLYSINLVVSDVLFALSLPLRIIYYARGFHWSFGEPLCKVTALAFYINTYAGVSFMTCLSVDRCIAVVWSRPLGRFRKVHNVRYICVLVWVAVLVQTLPLLFMPMTNSEFDGHTTCMEYPNYEKVPNLAFMLIGAFFMGYGIPMAIIIGCYLVICWKLMVVARKNPLAGKSGHNQKTIGVICGVILVFALCFSPYHVDLLQYMVRKLRYTPDCSELHSFQVSLHITVCLMNLNSCLDPFIYFFACKGYRKTIMRIMRRQVSTSFSSAAKTSPDGFSKDGVEGTHIALNTSKN